MSDFPEHDKLTAVKDHSQACADLLEWLEEQGIYLAQYETVSDACRNCDHEDSHRVPDKAGWWQCGAGGCECNLDDRGNPDRLLTTPRRRDALLAEHFGIDLKVLEEEKRAMLTMLREANAKATAAS